MAENTQVSPVRSTTPKPQIKLWEHTSLGVVVPTLLLIEARRELMRRFGDWRDVDLAILQQTAQDVLEMAERREIEQQEAEAWAEYEVERLAKEWLNETSFEFNNVVELTMDCPEPDPTTPAAAAITDDEIECELEFIVRTTDPYGDLELPLKRSVALENEKEAWRRKRAEAEAAKMAKAEKAKTITVGADQCVRPEVELTLEHFLFNTDRKRPVSKKKRKKKSRSASSFNDSVGAAPLAGPVALPRSEPKIDEASPFESVQDPVLRQDRVLTKAETSRIEQLRLELVDVEKNLATEKNRRKSRQLRAKVADLKRNISAEEKRPDGRKSERGETSNHRNNPGLKRARQRTLKKHGSVCADKSCARPGKFGPSSKLINHGYPVPNIEKLLSQISRCYEHAVLAWGQDKTFSTRSIAKHNNRRLEKLKKQRAA